MLIDFNTKLQDVSDETVNEDILKQAAASNVGKIICSSSSMEEWSLVSSVARHTERVVPFFGIHPWYAEQAPLKWQNQLMHVAVMFQGAGIGIVGLDRSPNGGNYDKQKEIFLHQLQMADKLLRPIAIHCVDAWEDLVAFLTKDKTQRTRFMIHDYQADPGMLSQLLKLGAYISFSRKSLLAADPVILKLLKQVPKDRLLLETGFPYVNTGGQLHKGATPEMYFKCLKEIYALAEKALEMDEGELENVIWENAAKYLTGHSASEKGSTKLKF